MALPDATTTITVLRPARAADADAFDPDSGPPDTVATGVRAHFSGVSYSEEPTVGTKVTMTATLLADPVDLRHSDRVVDDATGLEWDVGAARPVVDHEGGSDNLDHVTAPVTRTTGAG